MRRCTTALLIGLLAALVLSMPASAGRRWCYADPVVLIHGTEVQILVAVPPEYVAFVNGPISVDVRTPAWTPRQLLATDTGYNGYGETLSFSDLRGDVAYDPARAQTTVSVIVPLDVDALPRGVTVPVALALIPAKGPSKVTYGNAMGASVGIVVLSTAP